MDGRNNGIVEKWMVEKWDSRNNFLMCRSIIINKLAYLVLTVHV